MLRNLGIGLFLVAATLSAPSYSMATHTLQTGITLDYDLPANDPQVFSNYMFWTVEATCTVSSSDNNIILFAKVLAKKGKINDVEVATGNTIQMAMHSGESFKLSADSGAKVEITNLGTQNVHATCNS